jgi:hypothetical protein
VSEDIFERRMRELGERIHRNFSSFVKQTTDAVQEYLIVGTPVKTGRARNGWNVSPDEPNNSPPDMTGPFDPSGTTRIDANRAIIAGEPLGVHYFITNNVPYIGDLNSGSSQQAPEGFVEKAEAIARAKAMTFRRLIDE